MFKSPQSPSLGWLYVFSLFSLRPLPQQLLPLTSKPFELNLRYLGQGIYRSGKMYWVTFPWPKVMAVKNWNFDKFSLKILDVFFSRSNTVLAISQEWLVRLMWNENEVHGMDTGYNMWPWHLISLMTFLDLECFKVKFRNSCISGIGGLMWNAKEAN